VWLARAAAESIFNLIFVKNRKMREKIGSGTGGAVLWACAVHSSTFQERGLDLRDFDPDNQREGGVLHLIGDSCAFDW
jgi:hypothetical protein